jgi:FixJ family two-component response regulator
VEPFGIAARLYKTRRACITVVDDDDSFRESLHDLLKACDYDVLVFTSADALLASETWFDSGCLLVDATLPGTSGPELQQQLRARNCRVPIVFMTGYEDEELKASVIARGAVDCLCKPFEEEELLASLNRIFAAPP